MQEKKAKIKVKKLLTIPFIIGLAMFGYGIFSIVHYFVFENHATHVMGIVEQVRHESMRGRRGAVSIYRPVFKITVPKSGNELSVVATTASHAFNYKPGDKVEVEFDPENITSTLKVAGSPSILDIGIGLLGLLFVARGIREKYFV